MQSNFAIVIAGSLSLALPFPSAAAPGRLAGFGDIPFGTSFAQAKLAPGIDIREDACTPAECRLVYRTAVRELDVTVWQDFAGGVADLAEVLVRGDGQGGRFVNSSRCDATFNRVYLLVTEVYGPADIPIVLRHEPTPEGYQVEVREVTWTFNDGARIRHKRDVTSDGTCAVRLFYRPGLIRASGTMF